ncbi:MAG TPA: MBL fold metallo-hydrolase [Nannocystaceae bacterium]|nr:MBL fold metallo-hydrolase [Nannocystaceae bacterium]
MRLALFAVLAVGCRATTHPSVAAPIVASASASPASWDEVFAQPAKVDVEVVLAARWAVAREGLIDLDHPEAKTAGLKKGDAPVILQVGIVRHPERGDFLVDSGIDRDLAKNEDGAVRGAVRRYLKKLRPVISTGELVEQRDLHVTGVLMTHLHLDHVLGLADVPDTATVWVGHGEPATRAKLYGLLRPTFGRLLAGKPAFAELPAHGIALDPIPDAIDLFGDRSIWALPSPGHTPGSVVWLVNASDGPVLFVGDTSHTRWGWEHGVPPGKFTMDGPANAERLTALRELVRTHPEIRVVVGHEP